MGGPITYLDPGGKGGSPLRSLLIVAGLIALVVVVALLAGSAT